MSAPVRWFVCLYVASLCVVGCSDLGEPLLLLPRPELSAVALDFGTVTVSGSSTRDVVLSNSGEAPLSGNATVSCADYTIVSGGGAFTVSPGGAHLVTVRYQPAGVGVSACTLELGAGLPSVSLSGEGALQSPGAVGEVLPGALDFGLLAVGGTRSDTFRLSSTGTASLRVDVASNCADFIVVSGGGPAMLAPGASIDVTVEFTPTAGGHRSCVIATGPGLPDVAVDGDATSVSFSAQIRPFFNANLCTIACHTTPLTPSTMVNVPSPDWAPAVRVKPFDLANSVLYQKVTGNPAFGDRMPLALPALTGPQLNLIRTWILEGAHDN